MEERGRRLALVCRKLDATLSEPEQRARQTLGRVEAFSRLELEVPASRSGGGLSRGGGGRGERAEQLSRKPCKVVSSSPRGYYG